MIDYDLLNKQIHQFNPIKMNPRDRLIQEQIDSFMKAMNEQLAKSYQEKYGKPISNYPTDEMIQFTSSNEISTLCMSNLFSMIYDENSGNIVLEGPVYDLHQRGIGNEEFNALLLWTRVFAKIGSIELVKHDREAKLIEFKVTDENLVKNLIEYNEVDLENVRKNLSALNMEKYSQYLDKYADENRFKNMSEKEKEQMVEKDMTDMLLQMMNDIQRIMPNGK